MNADTIPYLQPGNTVNKSCKILNDTIGQVKKLSRIKGGKGILVKDDGVGYTISTTPTIKVQGEGRTVDYSYNGPFNVKIYETTGLLIGGYDVTGTLKFPNSVNLGTRGLVKDCSGYATSAYFSPWQSLDNVVYSRSWSPFATGNLVINLNIKWETSTLKYNCYYSALTFSSSGTPFSQYTDRYVIPLAIATYASGEYTHVEQLHYGVPNIDGRLWG